MFPFCFRAVETRYSLLPWTYNVSVMIPEREYDHLFPLHLCHRCLFPLRFLVLIQIVIIVK